jgi:hypothetical protein
LSGTFIIKNKEIIFNEYEIEYLPLSFNNPEDANEINSMMLIH